MKQSYCTSLVADMSIPNATARLSRMQWVCLPSLGVAGAETDAYGALHQHLQHPPVPQ